MQILGIETSTKAASVAVISDDKVLAEVIQESHSPHSETLQVHIEEVLKNSGAEKKIDAVAVSIGPGSFTGLRIGLAAAKVLAYVWKIKIIGVPTLQAMSYNFPTNSVTVLPLIDAQKNRAYVQQFRNCSPQNNIEVKPIDEIVTSAEQIDGEVFLCGDVLHKIKVELPENVKFAPINFQMPRASNVALCGKNLLDAGKEDNLMNLEPLYVRRSEAEVLWEKRQQLLSEK